MKILELEQGSPAWLAVRASYQCSSDAAPMMGTGHISRADLVRMRANGEEREFSEYVRNNVIEPGHEVEALARPIVEAELGESLYPVTAVDDTDTYLASFDGLTMDEETAWECKRWNAELAAAVKRNEVPDGYWEQLEHQRLVNPGLKRQLFTVSDGTPENTITIEYQPVAERRARLIAGWKQFRVDVDGYVHVEHPTKPAATLQASFPAVSVEVKGTVGIVSNLADFRTRLAAYIEAIPGTPATDEDFANCEQAVKDLKEGEERLAAIEDATLAKFEDIETLRTEIAWCKETMRRTRLATDKLVKERKDAIRDEIRREGIQKLSEHVTNLNKRLGRPLMPTIVADFATAMKGKKTVKSLRDAVDTELARTKIAASETADRIEINLKALAEHAAGFDFLFADLAHLVQKAPDDFALAVKSRVAEHKDREAKKAEEEAKRKAEAEERARHSTATLAAAAGAGAAPLEVNRMPNVVPLAARAPAEKVRPTPEQLVGALALAFRVHELEVIAWLRDLDLDALSARYAKEFAATLPTTKGSP